MDNKKFDLLFEQVLKQTVEKEGQKLKMKERFKTLEKERKQILLAPEVAQTDIYLSLGRKAAFMHMAAINSSTLPVSNETIRQFLAKDEKPKKSPRKNSD